MAFTASQLYNAQDKLDQMFTGARFNAHLNKPVPSLIAALERQTARFNPIMTTTRQTRSVEVSFLKGAMTVVDAGITPVDSCDIGGDQGSSDKITITADEDIYVEFTVMDDQVNDMFSVEEKLAERMAMAMSELRLKWNNKILAWWNSNIMLPVIKSGDGTLSGSVIQVPKATLSSADYIATVQALANENDIYNSFLVSSRMFWIEKYKAMFKSQACCSVDALFDGPFDIVFDMKNLDSIVGTNAVLLIDAGAYAVWPTNDFFNDKPEERTADSMSFRLKDPILQFADGGSMKPVYYDVIAQKKCVISDESPAHERWGTSFRIHKRFGKTLAPDPGNLGTGIIEFNGV